MLIAIANLLISSSNFLFPVETVSLNSSVLQTSIERDTRRLDPNSPNFANFLLHVPPKIREKIQSRVSFFYVLNFLYFLIDKHLNC